MEIVESTVSNQGLVEAALAREDIRGGEVDPVFEAEEEVEVAEPSVSVDGGDAESEASKRGG